MTVREDTRSLHLVDTLLHPIPNQRLSKEHEPSTMPCVDSSLMGCLSKKAKATPPCRSVNLGHMMQQGTSGILSLSLHVHNIK